MESALKVADQLYAAATGEEDWNDLLCTLADFCGAENAALVRADQFIGHSSVLAPRADPAVIAAYNEKWWAEDPTIKATNTAPVGRITSLANTGHDVFRTSSFHNEFWAASGLGAERLAVNLDLGKDHFASCVLHASADQDEFDHWARDRFAILVPHLIRAVTIQERLQRLAVEKAALTALKDTSRRGIIVVDAWSRILFADEQGEALLAKGAGLRLYSRSLELDDLVAHESLQRAVMACAGHHQDVAAPRHIPWVGRNGGPALSIEVLPWSRTLAGFDISGRQPAAILLLHDLQTRAEIPAGRDEGRDDKRPEPAPRSQTRAELFDAVTQDIRNNLDDSDVSLSWLASRHGISPRRIRDLFYAENTNFTDYLLSARLERAKEMLSDPGLGHINVASIALDCGFGDISWFHHTFRRRFKLTPADMRKNRKDLK